ncbi:MAG: cupredoxin domain-containing protein [Nitriliruptoraceae bacterium]
MKRTNLIAAAAGAALLLTGCGGGDAGGEGAASDGDVAIVATEFAFEPAAVSIAADTDVVVTIDNTGGAVEHDFTIDELDVLIHAEPTEAASGTINAPAGTYTFYCSIPGHRAAGMEGELSVG